jgi:S1-C subfamily serine protease
VKLLLLVLHRVTLADQSVYEAQVVGYDQDKDVAVLRIKAPKDKLRPIPVGVSATLLVGQKVFAIGNPVSASASIFLALQLMILLNYLYLLLWL